MWKHFLLIALSYVATHRRRITSSNSIVEVDFQSSSGNYWAHLLLDFSVLNWFTHLLIKYLNLFSIFFLSLINAHLLVLNKILTLLFCCLLLRACIEGRCRHGSAAYYRFFNLSKLLFTIIESYFNINLNRVKRKLCAPRSFKFNQFIQFLLSYL